MPEIPEVDRVAKILRDAGLGKTIDKITTTEDTIVFTGGITNKDFVGSSSLFFRLVIDTSTT